MKQIDVAQNKHLFPADKLETVFEIKNVKIFQSKKADNLGKSFSAENFYISMWFFSVVFWFFFLKEASKNNRNYSRSSVYFS